MQTTKFLLSQADFFVYIKITSIPDHSIYFGLKTSTLFGFVPEIKQFVLEMCSGVPP